MANFEIGQRVTARLNGNIQWGRIMLDESLPAFTHEVTVLSKFPEHCHVLLLGHVLCVRRDCLEVPKAEPVA